MTTVCPITEQGGSPRITIQKNMELGLITFADMEPEGLQNNGKAAHQRIRDLMEEIRLADQLGLDVFGIGEHHRPDYAVSSPTTILAATAMVTKRIKLSS